MKLYQVIEHQDRGYGEYDTFTTLITEDESKAKALVSCNQYESAEEYSNVEKKWELKTWEDGTPGESVYTAFVLSEKENARYMSQYDYE